MSRYDPTAQNNTGFKVRSVREWPERIPGYSIDRPAPRAKSRRTPSQIISSAQLLALPARSQDLSLFPGPDVLGRDLPSYIKQTPLFRGLLADNFRCGCVAAGADFFIHAVFQFGSERYLQGQLAIQRSFQFRVN